MDQRLSIKPIANPSHVVQPLTTAVSPSLIPEDMDKLSSSFKRAGVAEFSGYIYDKSDLSRRFVVQISVDQVPLQLATADLFDASISGIGDGRYGFRFVLAEDMITEARSVSVRVANLSILVGNELDLSSKYSLARSIHETGVRWIGGLRFFGWIASDDDIVPHVTARIDGETVAEIDARNWHQIGDGQEGQVVPAFDLNLPERFADGRVRSVNILNDEGVDLAGSPITFVAFDNGLEQTISNLGETDHERLRGELFDRLIPASLPMASYERWIERFQTNVYTPESTQTVGVIFAGHSDDELSVRSLASQTYANWVAATLSADGDCQFPPGQLADFLNNEASDCDLLIFAYVSLSLTSDAIAKLVAALGQHPQAIAAYADLAVRSETGELWPILYPAFDYERLLEQGYGSYLFIARREALLSVLNDRPASLFRLFNALAADPIIAPGRIVHIPEALATFSAIDCDAAAPTLAAATKEHLAARGVDADVTITSGDLFPAVRVERKTPLASVSVIIPTRNQVALLQRCLKTIAPAVHRSGGEIIIADNDSSDDETLNFLDSLGGDDLRVVRVPGAFNFSRINNIAVEEARGEYLCLLNNDIEALDEAWLDEMLGRISEPDVGAVGATLLWPSGLIQHAGVVLGSNFGAVHAFTDRMDDDPGYGDMLSVARECSAVTAACLLTRASDYRAVGGLDEVFFPVNFNDVDYCLKLRAMGRRIVMTPHARLLHLESASRGHDRQPDRAARMSRELRSLRARWLDVLTGDPYYSPLLSLDSIPFSALAWPPRQREPRFNRPSRPAAIPPGM